MPIHGGRFREVFNPEQLEDLKNYLTAMDKMFFGMTKQQCRRLVFDFAEQCEISHPFNTETRMAGEDWLASFIKKFKFSIRKPEATSIARAMGFNKPSVDKFFFILKDMREKHKFPASSIYNADESGLSTVPNKLPKVISPTGTKRVSKIVSAERGRNVTIICCINATGYYLPPFLVFARKRMRPELVERAPPGTVGHCSDNGWSNGDIFVLFLKHFNCHVKPTAESPVLLLVDNHKTHLTLEAINFCRENHIIMVGFPPHTTHRLQPLDVSFFGPLKTYYSQACDNFMVSHPGKPITDKNIGELLSTAYFKAATVGNAVNGFKECGIEPYDPLVFNEHDFAAAKTTDHVPFTDNVESENATAHAAAPKGQSTETPDESPEEHEAEQNEEPGPSRNATSVKPKPCQSIFDLKPLPKERPSVRKRKSQCASVITSTPMKEMLSQKEAQKVEQERLKQQRQEARDAKKLVVTKKLKFDSCKKTKKHELPTPMTSAQTSEESIVKCPVCDEIYVDPPSEDWIECYKCHTWWHEDCSNFEGGKFVCDFC